MDKKLFICLGEERALETSHLWIRHPMSKCWPQVLLTLQVVSVSQQTFRGSKDRKSVPQRSSDDGWRYGSPASRLIIQERVQMELVSTECAGISKSSIPGPRRISTHQTLKQMHATGWHFNEERCMFLPIPSEVLNKFKHAVACIELFYHLQSAIALLLN